MVRFMRELLEEVSWDSSREQCVAMDTQFNLGPFYVTTVTARDPRMVSKKTDVIPIVPAFLIIHEHKYQLDHQLALKMITTVVPELRQKHFVSSSDAEFTSLLIQAFPKSTVVKDENHVVKQIIRAVEKRGGNQEEKTFYAKEFRALIRAETREEYEVLVKARRELWRPTIRDYFDGFVLPKIDR